MSIQAFRGQGYCLTQYSGCPESIPGYLHSSISSFPRRFLIQVPGGTAADRPVLQ
jgi:hypothetical protein